MKMWHGRFKDASDTRADDYNTSLPVDARMYKEDIEGSIAHATMLGECSIIQKNESALIIKGLQEILQGIENGSLSFDKAEDIHMFVEEELTRRIGIAGKKLHTARSRNDQVALDIRMYLKNSVKEIIGLIKNLICEFIKIAEDNFETIVPAYTHMQKAQPTTLAHYYAAYAEMLFRDADRFADLFKRLDVMPLGSGALTGTSYPINRERVAELLGFSKVTQNSIDAVSDRDFGIEFISSSSILMMHLSRYNEEIIYWTTNEFNYAEISDAFSTGSSIMPQKKNPDMNELMRGKTGRVYGNLVALLTVMKGLPLAYNKDMQEDKYVIFDTEDTVKDSLSILAAILPSITFNKEKLLKGAAGGFTEATDIADYLVKKGLPFRDAHAVVGSLVIHCAENNLTLNNLNLSDFKKFSPLFENDIKEILQLKNLIAARNLTGGPAPKAMKKQIADLKTRLDKITL